MNRWLIALWLLPAWAAADYLAVEDGGRNHFVGPTKQEVTLLEIGETPPVGSDRPMAAKVRNDSGVYLDRVAVECVVWDERGLRVFEDLVFKSGPLFSVHIAFPPVRSPQIGIPPGAVAEVGLYTDDNRWTRGHGALRYDCELYGVGGRP